MASPVECPHLYLVGDTECRLCLQDITGLLYWSTDRATVGLEVRKGVVIDAPPYAQKWAMGRHVADLPPARESVFLTDQTDEQGVDWGDMDQPEAAASWSPEEYPGTREAPRATYPEYPPLQEAPISINFKVTGEPQITVRGFDAHQITALLNDLEERGAWANIAAAQASLRVQGQVGAGLGPVSPAGPQPGAQPPYGGPQQQFQQGPPFGPNVSVPSAPGYVGPPSYQSGPPNAGGWGGAPGGGNSQGRAEPKPQPPGWMRINARSGPGFDAWKQLREQHKENLKGKIQWGGKSDYWIEPSLAQWLVGMGYAVTP